MDDKSKLMLGVAAAATVAVMVGSRAVAAKPSTAAPGTPSTGSPKPPTGGSSNPTPPAPSNPCDLTAFSYSAPLLGFGKSRAEAERRIIEHMRDEIGGIMFDQFKRVGIPIVTPADAEAVLKSMATYFYDAASVTGMPLDLVLAIAWKESRFKLEEIINVNSRLKSGIAVGLMQVQRLAVIDAGFQPENIGAGGAGWKAILSDTTWAGVKYLAKCRNTYRPRGNGWTWPEVVMCYTEGPGGSKTPDRCAGKRKYVADVLAKARDYSDLNKL